ncbi:putative cell survival pathways protein, partial [Ascosphaera atra]
SAWNFCNFQSKSFSACLMEFTTPPSYGSSTVTVGGLAKEGEIICAGTDNSTTHLESAKDTDNDWPEPKAIRYEWNGKTKDGKDVHAELSGPIGKRVDRIDVMAEIPGFVKSFIGSVAGTKPYIYQYIPDPNIPLKIKIGDEEFEETGVTFCEATFIS